MAGITLYEASITPLIRGTMALRDILKKACSHPDAASIPTTKLAEDMLPLNFQLGMVSNMAEKTVNIFTGSQVPLSEGKDTTLEEIIAHCEKTIELLRSVKPEQVNGREDEAMEVMLGPKKAIITGRELPYGYIQPNFFFHLISSYSILRMKGVDIGKMDYLSPFMVDIMKRNAPVASS